MDKSKDETSRFFWCLNHHQVRYLLVGGTASAYYGVARQNDDLDIWLDDDRQNRLNLVEALKAFGFEGASVYAEAALDKGRRDLQLNDGSYIDLMTNLKGARADFKTCYAKAEGIKLAQGIEAKTIDKQTLIDIKADSARAQDKAEAEELRRTKNG